MGKNNICKEFHMFQKQKNLRGFTIFVLKINVKLILEHFTTFFKMNAFRPEAE